MGHETLRVDESPAGHPPDTARPADTPDGLAVRLSQLEMAYEALLALVRGYERERAEIRDRVARLLVLLAGLHLTD
jgi:hypothetical protein